jgi:hypothetical protein
MMGRRPWITNQKTAITMGLLGFALSVMILYDAYERRGARTPVLLRPFLPT